MRALKMLSTAAIALSLVVPTLAAQEPTTGWRAEFLGQMNTVEKKFTQLAEATPWEKYSWRPGQGVRSVCEVFLHVAGDNYLFAEPLGVKKPASVDYKTMEICPDSKEKVLTAMKVGFAHMKSAALATADADADATVDLFRRKFTKRGLFLAVAEHAGEHLGQSIAYARTNGIVPPWSAKSGM